MESFSDSIVQLTPESNDMFKEQRKKLYEEFIQASEELVRNNPDKIVSAVAIHEYLIKNGMLDATKAKELFMQFDDLIKYSPSGIQIGTHINKALSLEIGKTAPYFEFHDLRGVKHTLSDFKNNTVVLHFWSSTCGPCRAENNMIKELYDNTKSITIINVSLDTNENHWKKAIIKDGLSDMINTCDLTGLKNKIAQDYYIHGIPMHYVIDGEGKILGKGSLKEVKSTISAP